MKELEKRDWPPFDLRRHYLHHSESRLCEVGKNRRLYAEKISKIVTDRLDESFNNLMNYDFTDLEGQLDKSRVTEGAQLEELLDNFYGDFKQRLTTLGEKAERCVSTCRWKSPLCTARNATARCRSAPAQPGIPWLFRLQPAAERRPQRHAEFDAGRIFGRFIRMTLTETADLMSKKAARVCGTAMDTA